MDRKYIIFLFGLFVVVLFFRLFFAFQTPLFTGNDAYNTLRQVELIKENGLPFINDELSYGGIDYFILPVFHYILAFFSIFLPDALAYKLIPNILATALIFPVFFFVRNMVKNDNIALFTAFVSSFIPIYIGETVNSISKYSIIAPLFVLLMYFFLRINMKRDARPFIVLLLLFIFTDFSVIILVLSILLYLLFAWTEGLKIKRREIELILFSVFITISIYFLIFNDLLLEKGASIIYGNIPQEELAIYFSGLDIVSVLINIGILPLLSLVIVSFIYFSKKKKKSVYLPMSAGFVTAALLFTKLIPFIYGLIILGVIAAILFGELLSIITAYFEKTKFSDYWWGVYAVFFLLFLATSVLPSVSSADAAIEATPDGELVDGLRELKEISAGEDVIASTPETGSLVSYFSERRNVMDLNYFAGRDVETRYSDLRSIYSTSLTTRAIQDMEKYNIKYIILDESAKEKYNISQLSYADDRCFPKVISKEKTNIYMRNCTLVRR